ncbi:MAG: hypothetical protein WAP51_01780 [Candidatus Sungiibacteriota bacterium]
MLTLNLLPPQQKENLNYEIDRRMVQFLGLWFSVVVIIFGVLILPAFFFISFQQSEAERAKSIEEGARQAARTTEAEEKILRINNLLDVIVAREGKKQDVSPFLKEVLSRSPAGVSIALITFTPAENRATVAGLAATRSGLLKFIDLLKGSPGIKAVTSPVSNIIQEEDINFSLSIETGP